jgi:hypothetical protein
MVLNNFTANGADQLHQKGTQFNRKGLLSYYVVDNEPWKCNLVLMHPPYLKWNY